MNRTALRRVAAPSLAALTLGLALSACGTEASAGIKGAGSSAQEAAMDAWRAGYQTENSDVTINYDPAGSGAGIEKFNDSAVDYAGSDAALDQEKGEVDAAKKRCGGVNALEVPTYVSPISVAFKLEGVDALKLDAKTIANIFNGTVKKWNDKAIADQNPGVSLPDTDIKPVHRSDESGTTKNFTDYLSQASEGAWTEPADKVWPKDLTGEAANGTSGVIAAIKEGSIGYADESQVTDALSQVEIKVGDAYVAPSAEGAAAALADSERDATRTEGDIAIKVNRTTTAPGAYPLLLLSYVIACPTYAADTADIVKGFLSYVVSTEGQAAAAESAGSAPLPSVLQADAAKVVAGITKK